MLTALLHVPPLVSDLHGGIAKPRGASAREPLVDARAARHSRCPFHRWADGSASDRSAPTFAPADGSMPEGGSQSTRDYPQRPRRRCGAGRVVHCRSHLPAAIRISRTTCRYIPCRIQSFSNKYYVDEIYGFIIVKPLLAGSKYLLEWVVDVAILGGLAWLLGGIATLGGAILQRWQSGNLRSYAAWLALGAAVLLLFVLAPYMLRAPAGINSHGRGTRE